MNKIKFTTALLAGVLSLAGCAEDSAPVVESGPQVATSGKETTALADVPEAVIAAAMAARPELSITQAEHEVRDGREYYDVGGLLPDGSELELDMTLLDGIWTVVEVQRDIDMATVPPAVATALAGAATDWTPDRIIESDQGDGVVIYEFFGPGPAGDKVKIEVKWEGDAAVVLANEWLH